MSLALTALGFDVTQPLKRTLAAPFVAARAGTAARPGEKQ